MAMPVITLKHLKHRGGNHIGLYFDYDPKLINHTKKIDGTKWSASNKCWYLPNTSSNFKQIFDKFKGIAWLDLENLKKQPRKKAQKDRRKPKLHRYKSKITAIAKNS